MSYRFQPRLTFSLLRFLLLVSLLCAEIVPSTVRTEDLPGHAVEFPGGSFAVGLVKIGEGDTKTNLLMNLNDPTGLSADSSLFVHPVPSVRYRMSLGDQETSLRLRIQGGLGLRSFLEETSLSLLLAPGLELPLGAQGRFALVFDLPFQLISLEEDEIVGLGLAPGVRYEISLRGGFYLALEYELLLNFILTGVGATDINPLLISGLLGVRF